MTRKMNTSKNSRGDRPEINLGVVIFNLVPCCPNVEESKGDGSKHHIQSLSRLNLITE